MNGILSDLDDFLAPTAECIKMIPEPSKKGIMKPGGETKAIVQMDNDFDFEQSIKVELNNNKPQQQ